MTDHEEKPEASRFKRLLKSRLLLRPPVDLDPRNFSNLQKGVIIASIAMCATSSGFSSTIYFPGLPDITVDLKAPSMATTLTAALFILFMGIAPIFWAAISDYYQMRRWLFIFSMAIFAVSSLGSAVMTNIWGLVVMRCIQSVGASCGQSVGAGVIADCYPIERRGAAFGKFFFGTFVGPLVGPIIGGFLIMSDQSWRATFWFCLAFALSVMLFLFICLPETYRVDGKFDTPSLPTVAEGSPASTNSSSDQVQVSLSSTASIEDENKSIQKPEKPEQPQRRLNIIAPFLMLRHSFVMLTAFVSAVAFGSMFAVETIIPGLYKTHYNFTEWQIGLSYLGAGIGNFIAAILNGQISDRLLLRERKRRGGQPLAEDRLTINLWPAGLIFMPFGQLLFGWAIVYDLPVWAPIIGFGIQNFGMNQIMTSTSAYLVDAIAGQGASATAAANLVRMVLACALTLAANPMVADIGPGYTVVLLAALAWLSMAVLFVVKRWGPRMRAAAGFKDALH